MTHLTLAEVKDIVHAATMQIQLFLGHADPEDYSGDAREAILAFHRDPGDFTEEVLLQKGADIEHAHKYPVRIELRGRNAQGAAQVSAKGVWGPSRQRAREALLKEMKRHSETLSVRVAGSSSLEFNRAGVDKSLPIRFMRACWEDLLHKSGYTPGPSIDSRKSRILIASDGDGTLYEGPKTTHMQLLKDSPVFDPLLKYLKAGGVFMLISGNDLTRTYRRVIEGVPPQVYSRIFLAANGGADLAHLALDGKPVVVEEYRRTALEAAKADRKRPALDIFYLGDDSSPTGNDYPAFAAVGKDRAVLINNLNETKTFVEKWMHERKIGAA